MVYEDNQVITLDELNKTATDLGATDFSVFDSEKFGVDKLNEITKAVVGKGVLATSDECMPVLSGNAVYIQKGMIVFDSGAKIHIEEPVRVDAAKGDFIYAFNDISTGRASIVAAADMPTSGDYVMLAQLNSAGDAVADLREKAVAKITIPAEMQNNYAEQTVEFDMMSQEEIAVLPAMPQCKCLTLINTTWGWDNALVDNTFRCNPVLLTEEYQYVFRTSWYSLRVKKVGSILWFRCSANYPNKFSGSITFILS